MKNLLLLAILLVPMLSFGQLKKKDKKAVEQYADHMCGCVNEVLNTLDPKTIEFIVIIGKEGDAAGEAAIKEYMATATEGEVNSVIESFNKMSSNEFQKSIEECDTRPNLNDEIAGSIN